MLRTHKPRGHLWNCASVFQQTPLFRDINYDDSESVPIADEVVDPYDTEDAFYLRERIAKRRRVEKYADDFLNGFNPEIRTVTLDPRAVKNAITYSCFERPREATAALHKVEAEKVDEDIGWESMDNDRDVMQQYITQFTSRTLNQRKNETVRVQNFEVIGVEVRASCGTSEGFDSAKVARSTTDEALGSGAMIQSRVSRRAKLDVTVERQTQSCPRSRVYGSQIRPSSQDTLESESDAEPLRPPVKTGSNRVKNGISGQRHQHTDERHGRAELVLSPCFTFSEGSHTDSHRKSNTLASDQSGFSISTGVVQLPDPGQYPLAASKTLDRVETTNNHGISTQKPNPADEEYIRMSLASPTHQQTKVPDVPRESDKFRISDSIQSILSPDGNPHVNSFQMSGTMGETSGASGSSGNYARNKLNTDGSFSCSIAQPITEKPEVLKIPKGEDAGSLRAFPTRHIEDSRDQRQCLSADTFGAAYVVEPPPGGHLNDGLSSLKMSYKESDGKCGSPFIYFKRALNPNFKARSDSAACTSSTSRGNDQAETTVASRFSDRVTPVIEALPRSSSSAEKTIHATGPYTPLVNEHLNTILPRESCSEKRPHSIRKVLRDELLASGAEISLFVEDECANDGNGCRKAAGAAATTVNSETKTWPGAQLLLRQAQGNLFASRKTAEDRLPPSNNASACTDAETEGHKHREVGQTPSRQLLQEPIPAPSTQLLLNEWKGWSTVKKTRPMGKHTKIANPSIVGEGSPGIKLTESIEPYRTQDRRRSSLRFSLSFGDRPASPDAASERRQLLTLNPKSPKTHESDGFLPLHPDNTDSMEVNIGRSFPGNTAKPNSCRASTQESATGNVENSMSEERRAQMLLNMESQEINEVMTTLETHILGSASFSF